MKAWDKTRKGGATGVDGQTSLEYEKNLPRNLQSLLERMKSGNYKAPPTKRAYIPKADGSLREIGVPKDVDAKAQIRKHIRQAEEGNFRNYRSLGGGVFELKIFKGPGYRVYFGIDGDSLVIIISGGDKSSQGRDINKAKELWQQYLESRRS